MRGNAAACPDTAGISLYGLYLLSLAASGLGNLLIRVAGEAGWFGASTQLFVAVLSALPLLAAAFAIARKRYE